MKQNSIFFSMESLFNSVAGLKDLSGYEPLASLDYMKELEIKNKVLEGFWKKNKLPGNPESIIASPKARKYRTTSKRKVVFSNNTFHLAINPGIHIKEPIEISLIEPDEHASIFQKSCEMLNKPVYKPIALNANFLVIRGNYDEFSVILNLKKANSQIINKVKSFADELKINGIRIISFFIYIDPTGSKYYFESHAIQDSIMQLKKIYGKDHLSVTFGNQKYFYHPTSFSQINQSITGIMLENIKNIFGGEGRLLDLYCGYGLFTYYLADSYNEVFGMDAEGESISSARESLRYKKNKSRIKFVSGNITSYSLAKILPPVNMDESVILDPPRQGTKEGVIKTITMRHPEKILHIFCGTENIPSECSQYLNNGYDVKRIIPLDLFPGTPYFEIMFLFEKK